MLTECKAHLRDAGEGYLEHLRFAALVGGMLIGGILAAPLGALVAKRIEADKLLVLVGIVLTLTSGYGLYRFFS